MVLTQLMKEDTKIVQLSKTYNDLLLNNTLVQNYLKKLWGK